MRPPRSYPGLEALGRERLSRHFEMRNFLHSEIASYYGRQNIPEDPDLALAAGRGLAKHILDPLVETFGPIDIRSGYRSPRLNHFGATQVKPQRMARNSANFGNHIWDRRDDAGRIGACVTVGVPWFAVQYNQGRDWRDLAWWLHDHLPFQSVCFFPRNAAFNVTWNEGWMGAEAPPSRIDSYIAPKGILVGRDRMPNPDRASCYADFPAFRGIRYPDLPAVVPMET